MFTKKESKLCLMRWILLLQNFDLEIRDTMELENMTADHLSRLSKEVIEDYGDVVEEILYEELVVGIQTKDGVPWDAIIISYKVVRVLSSYHPMTIHTKGKNFFGR